MRYIMKATEILSDEHRVIMRVIDALNKATKKLESGQEIRSTFFLDAADFIKGFADGCHHKKEEGVLFLEMENYGIPNKGGPIGVMLSDHEQGRAFTKGMRAATQRWIDGDETARKDIILNANGYINLLTQHIYKEDNILFPMADRFISPDGQEKIALGFEAVEHEETGEGVHEKYLALAELLENEIRI